MDGRSLPRRRTWLALASLGIGLAGCARAVEGATQGVVLITCDTLRADRLGLYGYELATSPNLDRLAQEALVFDRAWSTAPITGPALSALHTGRLPEELGLENNRKVLASEAATLAEVLAAHGVATAAIVSNWVLRRHAELADAGLQQGFGHFDDHMESIEPSRPHLKERLAPDTTSAAIRWLDEHAHRTPFFLWVHYQDPHGPYTPPADCLGAQTLEPGDEALLAVGTDQRGKGVLPAYQVVDDERRPAAYRQRYDAEIRFFDRELGRLLDHLRTSGELDRVLLIFSADHGESLGEHGYFFSHGQNLHAELLHVPLLLRPPGGFRPRSGNTNADHVRAPVSHLDLFPTVLAALGFEAGPTRGLDLLGPTLPENRVLPQFLRGAWSATDSRHRLIVENDTQQLYDIERDPHEDHDLAASQPEIVRRLAAAHEELIRRASGPPLRAAQPLPGNTDTRELDALGY